MSGLRQNVCCVEEFRVRITFSYSNLHDMTNSITEISESQSAVARVAGNTALVCMAVYIQVWGNACTHYLLTQHWVSLKVLAEETLTNSNQPSLKNDQDIAVTSTYRQTDRHTHIQN